MCLYAPLTGPREIWRGPKGGPKGSKMGPNGLKWGILGPEMGKLQLDSMDQTSHISPGAATNPRFVLVAL